MKQYVMNVEPELIKSVDLLVGKEGLYSSRNEFVRDAIRSKVLEYRKLKVRKLLKQAGEKALKNGWNGEMPTKEERDRVAKEIIREQGFSVD
ncbi:MAG: ribbon-helix-helix domain-containing protein [archaeon]